MRGSAKYTSRSILPSNNSGRRCRGCGTLRGRAVPSAISDSSNYSWRARNSFSDGARQRLKHPSGIARRLLPLSGRPVCFDNGTRELLGRPVCFDHGIRELPGRPVCFDHGIRELPGRPVGFDNGVRRLPGRPVCFDNDVRQLSERHPCFGGEKSPPHRRWDGLGIFETGWSRDQ